MALVIIELAKENRVPFKRLSDVDISTTENGMDNSYTVSCAPLGNGQPLSEIFFIRYR
jgi:hypothetical protein